MWMPPRLKLDVNNHSPWASRSGHPSNEGRPLSMNLPPSREENALHGSVASESRVNFSEHIVVGARTRFRRRVRLMLTLRLRHTTLSAISQSCGVWGAKRYVYS